MKFYIETLGCKVNSYESNYITGALVNNGFLLTEKIEEAELIIINTCSVTNVADNKSLKTVRKLKRLNDRAIYVVCGCSTQNDHTKYEELGINILLGNREKSRIVELVNNYLENHTDYKKIVKNRNLDFEDMTLNKFNHTRAYIKIEDGCDNFCSYCIIPFVRGKQRSKDFEKVIEEAESLVQNGHKEIVLTGIHTGSYESNGKDFVDVINELSKIEGLKRVRLSSVEITELNEKFMQMLKKNKKFCNHLHIPLQAGSNKVLKIMNRKYDLAYFYKKIEEIKSIRPDISLTTDVIVGHPGEDDESFNETLKTVSEIKFSKVHVFPYSKRAGTKSSLMSEVVSDVEKKRRVHELISLSKRLEKEYYESFRGKTLEVLIEEVKCGKSYGHTDNYLEVELDREEEKNTLVEVVL